MTFVPPFLSLLSSLQSSLLLDRNIFSQLLISRRNRNIFPQLLADADVPVDVAGGFDSGRPSDFADLVLQLRHLSFPYRCVPFLAFRSS